MALTKVDVAKLYIAMFNRAPEKEGLDYWVEQSEGKTAVEVANDMLVSAAQYPDAYPQYANLDTTNPDSVKPVIVNIFSTLLNKDYDSDPEGIDYWVNDVVNNGKTIGEVATTIITIADRIAAGDFGEDLAAYENDAATIKAANTFENKADVAVYTAEHVESADIDGDGNPDLDVFKDILANVTDNELSAVEAQSKVTQLVANNANVAQDAIDATEEAADAAEEAGEEVVVEDVPMTKVLTSNQDVIEGGSKDDLFLSYIFDNQNTAQSGDMIDGKEGFDTLYADVGNSSDFAITLHTNSVEKVQFRSEATNTSNDVDGDNNIGSNDNANNKIDAERMNGTDWYESNNSRADLVIEDVRIDDDQITKDITIAMVDTDPGQVDFGVYFDQQSLRAAAPQTSGAQLNLKLMDITSASNGESYLKTNPYDTIMFKLDGTSYVLNLEGTISGDNATYETLLAAVQDAISKTAGLENVTAKISGDFSAIDSETGETIDNGKVITLVNNGDGVFETGGWKASDYIPSDSNYYTSQDIEMPESTSELITSTILLDNVGRGSDGGDLVVGGLSTGETSNSKGVEQFDITVQETSKLQSIGSTNSTLKEVYIVNGEAGGDLYVGNLDGVDAENNDDDQDHDGNDTQNGFTDVKIIDASKMTGSAHIAATVGNGSDTQSANNVYTLTSQKDEAVITVDQSGAQYDEFNFTLNTGSGDDAITAKVQNANDITFANANKIGNVKFNAGTGDDVYTSTNNYSTAVIDMGSGDDVVYIANENSKAQWAFNTNSLGNIGQGNTEYKMFKTSVVVTFEGIQSKVINIDYDAGTYTTSTKQINEAIKKAIESDDTLNDLLSVTNTGNDGLTITSKIDRQLDASDLQVSFIAPKYSEYDADNALYDDEDASLFDARQEISDTELTDAHQVWWPDSEGVDGDSETGIYANDGSAEDMYNSMFEAVDYSQSNMNNADADNTGDFATTYTSNQTATGLNSTNTTINTIEASSGNDVIVLSSKATDGYDVVKFDGNFGHDVIMNFNSGSHVGRADKLDFTSYLDSVANARGASANDDDDNDMRTEQSVQYSYVNELNGDAIKVDHNEVLVVKLSTIFDDSDLQETLNHNFFDLSADAVLKALNTNYDKFDDTKPADVDDWTKMEDSTLVLRVVQDKEITQNKDGKTELKADIDATNEIVYTVQLTTDADGHLQFKNLSEKGEIEYGKMFSTIADLDATTAIGTDDAAQDMVAVQSIMQAKAEGKDVITTDHTYDGANNLDLIIDNGVNVTVKGNTDNATYTFNEVNDESDTVTVKVSSDHAGSTVTLKGDVDNIDVTVTKNSTLDLQTDGSSIKVDAQANTTIKGNDSVSITVNDDNAAGITIDANEATGKITATLSDNGDTIIGGSASDDITLGDGDDTVITATAFKAADKITDFAGTNGGTAHDKLKFDLKAGATTTATGIKLTGNNIVGTKLLTSSLIKINTFGLSGTKLKIVASNSLETSSSLAHETAIAQLFSGSKIEFNRTNTTSSAAYTIKIHSKTANGTATALTIKDMAATATSSAVIYFYDTNDHKLEMIAFKAKDTATGDSKINTITSKVTKTIATFSNEADLTASDIILF